MTLWTALLCLTAATAAAAYPQALPDYRSATYRLREEMPAVALLATDRGLVLYPHRHPLGRLTVIDPTDDVTCKYIARDDLAVLYIPVSYRPVLKTLTGRDLSMDEGGSLVVYLKPSQVPAGFRRVFLQSAVTPHYRVPAYVPDGQVPDLEEVPLEEFSPAPVLTTLCVSPDKPRPVPALYSPDPQLVSFLGPSFDIHDLTPAQVTASKLPTVISPKSIDYV